MGPLDGIKILDLSRVFAGPFCSQILGDLGADVYKVESIGAGDLSRKHMVAEELNGESYAFLSLNRNKKSICIDLKQAEGRRIVLQLAEICDVVLHNFRPGVMERLGLDYDSLKRCNPRIIYASASGFGRTGPYSAKAGQDLVAQAMSGFAWRSGERNGPPVLCGEPIADCFAAMFLAQGILAALLVREKTGEGQEVSVSLLDAMFPPQCEPITAYLTSGRVVPRSTRPLYRAYRTKDEKWMVLVGLFRDNPLQHLCTILGLPDLSQDERFSTPEKANGANAHELEAIFAELFQSRTREEWITLLEQNDAICGPVNTIEETFSDAQVFHNDVIIEFDHPAVGKLRTVGFPTKFSKTSGRPGSPPPLLGQHTGDVLRMLGYSHEQIQQLRDEQVVD